MKRFALIVSIPRLLLVIAFVGIVGVVGSGSLGLSPPSIGHADTLITLYKLSYAADGPNAIYNTTSSSAATTEINNGWRLLGTYKYVNETGSSPIPVYRWHKTGTKLNIYTTNKSYVPTGYTYIGVAFYESSSATVPYGYCRSTASGYKLDYPCTTNPAPPPPPAPKPTPTPTPTPAPAPGPVTTAPRKTTTNNTAPGAAPAAPSSAADATVATGTASAMLVVPAGNASKIHLSYGAKDGLSLDTDDLAVSGATTTLTLTDLQASSDYIYQIVRTNSAGAVATSDPATFRTLGYNATLQFIDKHRKPVVGINGSINDSAGTKSKSDGSGKMSFTNLPAGNYTVTYTFNHHKYTQGFDTTSDTSAQTNPDGTPATIELTDVINVDNLTANAVTKSAPKKHGGAGTVVVIILLILLLGGGLWAFLRRRRRQRLLAEYSTLGSPLNGGQSDVMDQKSIEEYNKHQAPAGPLPAHAGESLRDMVLESMHAQAAQQPQSLPAEYTPPDGAWQLPPPEQPYLAAPEVSQPLPEPPPTLPTTPSNPSPEPGDSKNGTLHISH